MLRLCLSRSTSARSVHSHGQGNGLGDRPIRNVSDDHFFIPAGTPGCRLTHQAYLSELAYDGTIPSSFEHSVGLPGKRSVQRHAKRGRDFPTSGRQRSPPLCAGGQHAADYVGSDSGFGPGYAGGHLAFSSCRRRASGHGGDCLSLDRAAVLPCPRATELAVGWKRADNGYHRRSFRTTATTLAGNGARKLHRRRVRKSRLRWSRIKHL